MIERVMSLFDVIFILCKNFYFFSEEMEDFLFYSYLYYMYKELAQTTALCFEINDRRRSSAHTVYIIIVIVIIYYANHVVDNFGRARILYVT